MAVSKHICLLRLCPTSLGQLCEQRDIAPTVLHVWFFCDVKHTLLCPQKAMSLLSSYQRQLLVHRPEGEVVFRK